MDYVHTPSGQKHAWRCKSSAKFSLPIIRSLNRNPVHPLLVEGVTNGLLRLPSAMCVVACAEIAAFGSYDALVVRRVRCASERRKDFTHEMGHMVSHDQVRGGFDSR